MKILITTTSFLDTPGKHHELLAETGFIVDTMRGPVKADILLPIIADYDGVICGDDEFSRKVIKRGISGKLKVISKYGVGLDKIDLKAAKELGVPVLNTPGVNHITVAEHALALILTYLKNIHLEINITKNGGWDRLIGRELYGKKVGVLGLGKIGKELVKRVSVFGVDLFAYDIEYDDNFVNSFNIKKSESIKDLVLNIDILSIHIPLTNFTKHILDINIINMINKPLIIVNTSRALILEPRALINGLKSGRISAYLTDVMDNEPMDINHPLKDLPNVIITPHIGSRTYESVIRQGSMAINNLLNTLKQ